MEITLAKYKQTVIVKMLLSYGTCIVCPPFGIDTQ